MNKRHLFSSIALLSFAISGCSSLDLARQKHEDPHSLESESPQRFAALLAGDPTAAGEIAEAASIQRISSEKIYNDAGEQLLDIVARVAFKDSANTMTNEHSLQVYIQDVYGNERAETMEMLDNVENSHIADYAVTLPNAESIVIYWLAFSATNETDANNVLVLNNMGNGFDATHSQSWERTIITYELEPGTTDDVSVRGGLSHEYMANHFNINCTRQNLLCAIPVYYEQFTADEQRGDFYLDWYGTEPHQSQSSVGTALAPSLAPIGHVDYMNFHSVEFMMDCSRAINNQINLIGYLHNAQVWESLATPHTITCGQHNIIHWNNAVIETRELTF